jgi:hypothetical protein
VFRSDKAVFDLLSTSSIAGDEIIKATSSAYK